MLKNEADYKAKMKQNYDKRRGVRNGTGLNIGDRVYLPREKAEGVIHREHASPRSFIVATSNGQRRRTRFHIQPLPQIEVQSQPTIVASNGVSSNVQNETIVSSPRRSSRSNFGVAPRRFTNCC